MNIREGFVIRQVMGNNVVIAIGEASRDFRGMLKLNDTAAEIWTYISEGKDVDEIRALMLEKYDVEEEKLSDDIAKTVNYLIEQGFIEA